MPKNMITIISAFMEHSTPGMLSPKISLSVSGIIWFGPMKSGKKIILPQPFLVNPFFQERAHGNPIIVMYLNPLWNIVLEGKTLLRSTTETIFMTLKAGQPKIAWKTISTRDSPIGSISDMESLWNMASRLEILKIQQIG